MSIEEVLNHPVIIYHRLQDVDDGYGNKSWRVAGSSTVKAYVDQVNSIENTTDRDTVSIEKRLFLSASTALSATDQVSIDGVMYEVEGEPDRLELGDGSRHHIEVIVRRVE